MPFLKIFASSLLILSFVFGQQDWYPAYDRIHPSLGQRFMVASQEKHASAAGFRILEKGGNAIDAAVAVAYALSVTLPEAGNLAGGGFMLVYIKKEDKVYAIDYREKAPLAAWKDMFIDESGRVDKNLSRNSLWSSGVPGTVAGLDLVWQRFGSLDLKTCLDPAIALAERGFPVSYRLHNNLKKAKEAFLERNQIDLPFYPDGKTIETHQILKQPDLAKTIKLIADQGTKVFYHGEIGQKITQFMSRNKGLITADDLALYQAKFRDALTRDYRGYQVYTMPPPSSGGLHLLQLLKMMEAFPLKKWGYQDPRALQIMIEAMSMAYQDRAKFLGDPDFINVPVTALLSPVRLKKQHALLGKLLAESHRPNPALSAPKIHLQESHDTTHFSIIDEEGNMVSNTYTLNFRFGNKIMVPGTGMLLNNQMDDFVAKPGVANAYGLLGSEANAIAPEKRMLSSMAPTLVFKNKRPFLATGSPGGSRIITIVFQAIINLIDYDMNLAEATHAPRLHYQWQPDTVFTEKGFASPVLRFLKGKGYQLKTGPTIGSLQSVLRIDDVSFGASDPRSAGAASIGL